MNDQITDNPAPMSKRMQRFLANPPRRLLPEVVATRRNKIVRRGRPKGWLPDLCEMQRWQCYYCKRSMSRKPRRDNPGRQATLDHMLPISRGGRNQWNNLVAACLDCNRDKGSLTATEYAQVIEARRAETRERFRAQHESTVAKGDAPKGDI